MKKIMWWVAFVTSPFITLFLMDSMLIRKQQAPTMTMTMVEVKAKTEVVVTKPVTKATKVVAKAKPKVARPKITKLDQMIERLIPALIQVESGGKNTIIGDLHLTAKAYGCLQIRQPCVDDVNRIYGTKYRAEDMNGNRALSIQVCRKYLRFWGGRLKQPTFEALAALWNGGPDGPNSAKTVVYRAKVRKVL